MRKLIKSFVEILADELPAPIYEFGSYQVEGQEGFADLRVFFPGKKYVGCDMRHGKGVDIVMNIHEIDLPDSVAGTVLIFDTLEHVEFCRKAMSEVYRILKPGGMVVVSSVMKFRIHDYPNDYWRFTPEGFKSLLREFSYSLVDSVGEAAFPHTVVGVGVKGDLPEERIRSLADKMARWERAERQSPIKEGLKLFSPPVLLHIYQWFRR